MGNALRAALQRNETYRNNPPDAQRAEFRLEWAKFIRKEAEHYVEPRSPISDDQHCKAVQRISVGLSRKFGHILIDKRLRFGTSQKAFNLYLKFLWRLELAVTPPHCPIDRIVLQAAELDGNWTQCDSAKQYMKWVEGLRAKAGPQSLAEWEYEIWLQ